MKGRRVSTALAVFLAWFGFSAAPHAVAEISCERLAKAQSFSLGVNVGAGTLVSYEIAFSAVLRGSDAETCFTRLLEKGTREAQMYALAGLREVSPRSYTVAANRLRRQNFNVTTLATKEHGVLRREAGQDVLSRIESDRYQEVVRLLATYAVPSGPGSPKAASEHIELLKARALRAARRDK